MAKEKIFKCPSKRCRFNSKHIETIEKHVHKQHFEEFSQLPPYFTVKRWMFMVNNKGKTKGKCVICRKETNWNEETCRYEKYCSEKHRKEAGKIAKRNHKKVFGIESFFGDPKYQLEIMKKRKISGVYKFKDNESVDYMGSYEKDFLIFCDKIMNLNASDFGNPLDYNAVFYYTVEYFDFNQDYDAEIIEKHVGDHFYIPDFYIIPFNLLIEIKQSKNTHHKIVNIDNVKDNLKEQALLADKRFNYIKIYEKEYEEFVKLINGLKYEYILDYEYRDTKLKKIIH